MSLTEGLSLHFIEVTSSQISDKEGAPPPGSVVFGVSAGVGSHGQYQLSVCVCVGHPCLWW